MATRPDNKPADQGNNPAPTGASSNPAYLEAALRIPTSYPLGAPRVDHDVVGTIHESEAWNAPATGKMGITEPVPGIAVLHYVPTLGVSNGVTSPLNRAANYDFNIIRSKISGKREYEVADYNIYRVCIDGLRDLYHYARRIYGTLKWYSATNLYKPEALLIAMGLDVENWRSNTANLYQWLLNHRNSLVSAPTVPIGKISGRHNSYNTYFFTDGEASTSQVYLMRQAAFWSYEKVDEVRGITLRTFPRTYEEFTVMWDEMLTAFYNSTDVAIIATDIRRAFEGSIVTDLPETKEDYMAEFTKLDIVLQSIMNATIMRIDKSLIPRFKIEDDGGWLKCQPKWRTTETLGDSAYYRFTAQTKHINCVDSAPDANTIKASVRLKPLFTLRTFNYADDDTMVGQDITIESMGTEVVIGCDIYTAVDGSTGYNVPSALLTYDGVTTDAQYLSKMLAALANFDWHPPVVCFQRKLDRTFTVGGLVEDVQNYVPISDYNIAQIHEASLLAEFGMP